MQEIESKHCPKCKKLCIKDKVGNWFIRTFGGLVSHNISCDNEYLDKGELK